MSKIKELREEKNELYAEKQNIRKRLTAIRAITETTPPFKRSEPEFKALVDERTKITAELLEVDEEIREVKEEIEQEIQKEKEATKAQLVVSNNGDGWFNKVFQLVAAKMSSGDDRSAEELTRESIEDMKTIHRIYKETK